MAKFNEMKVLFDGYSSIDANFPNHFLTNSTCTLIKGIGGYNIIVDTMTPWDGPKILQALQENSVKPDDISAVVSTHGHSDHTGNNNLFLEAKWHIVGQSIMDKDKYLIHDPWTPFELTPDIQVIATPGHTLSCVSVVVTNSNFGTAVVAGDLFEKREDIDDPEIWQEAGSEDKVSQTENRSKIADMADWIIPGHGEAFPVSQNIREKLRNQLQKT